MPSLIFNIIVKFVTLSNVLPCPTTLYGNLQERVVLTVRPGNQGLDKRITPSQLSVWELSPPHFWRHLTSIGTEALSVRDGLCLRPSI